MGRRVHVFGESKSVTEQALSRLRERLEKNDDLFHLALAGGSTPKKLYQMMAKADLPWERIHLWWGDERFVAHDHEDSNFRMASEALVSKVDIESNQVHPWPIKKKPQTSASHYEKKLREFFPEDDGPTFDLVFLGMGDDGHTASLFPDTEGLEVVDRLAVANFVEKLDSYRLTLTYTALERAKEIVFLVTGDKKRDALVQVIQEGKLPSAKVLCKGKTLFYVDRKAGVGLTSPASASAV